MQALNQAVVQSTVQLGLEAIGIAQNRAYEAAALRACSAQYRNDLFVCQGDYPFLSQGSLPARPGPLKLGYGT